MFPGFLLKYMIGANVLSGKWSGKIIWSKYIPENNPRTSLKNYILEFSIQRTWLLNTIQRRGFNWNENSITKEHFYKFCNESMRISFVFIDILNTDSFERKEIARLCKNIFQSKNIPWLSKEVIFWIPMSLSPKTRCTHIFKAACIETFLSSCIGV